MFKHTKGTNSEFSRTPSPWPITSQKTARVNFMGSTEPGAVSYNTFESTSSNSVSMQSPEFPSDDTPLTVIEIENPFGEHIYIGTNGPNQRESEAITRALDWLAEKRSPNYGWANDTHMVILAKEVCLHTHTQNIIYSTFTSLFKHQIAKSLIT